MKKLYIATAIDYANGNPYIGHIYEKILADTEARVMRVQGHEVQFMTVLDVHDLIGIPYQIIIRQKKIENALFELKNRKAGEINRNVH